MNLHIGDWKLNGLADINIVLGKNGCGKSTLLRSIDNSRRAIPNLGHMAYMSPERAGQLSFDGNVEQTILVNDLNLPNQRRVNQAPQFKQQSVAQYKVLRSVVADDVEDHLMEKKEGAPTVFAYYIDQLNTLLDQVRLERNGAVFAIKRRSDGATVTPEQISSGESELISLGIEILVFERQAVAGKTNLLLLDEPDVHLHPDLQVRLMQFLANRIKARSFQVVLATHSTAILGALSSHEGVRIAFMKAGDRTLTFEPINEMYRRMLPMFGAHPLSNVFGEVPFLLVEGEDDVRIWQQAVRTSNGRIRVYPCPCDTVDQMTEYEQHAKRIMQSVYDAAKAYSLRDGDGKKEPLADDAPIIRMRLNCYAAENLLLTDEVLTALGSNWDSLRKAMDKWVEENSTHSKYAAMKAFQVSNYDRRDHKVKDIRNIIVGLIEGEKPWEVAVGQVIATLKPTDTTDYSLDGSIFSFLGKKVCSNLLA